MVTTKELNWMLNAAKFNKEYAECIEKKFTGKLPYRMVMNAILNNSWTNKSENNSYWSVSNTDSDKINYSIYYTMKTGVVEFTVLEAK
ncbi:MAG: hypothetical protein K9I82_02095 [Chitinophagaceae bacterium]|nr:hypothetical protein [Chitinophagaceae bacterium]